MALEVGSVVTIGKLVTGKVHGILGVLLNGLFLDLGDNCPGSANPLLCMLHDSCLMTIFGGILCFHQNG